jgi:DNA repair protein RecO (recombination protein O)
VSRQAGEPWREKLLVLPPFLGTDGERSTPSPAQLRDGFALTGFFLARHLYEPRGEPLPAARRQFIVAAVGGG